MARKPKHQTLQSLLIYEISLYYALREKEPGIKHNQIKHLRLINKSIKDYHAELEFKYPQWDSADNRDLLKNHIDFLTGIFTKQEAEKKKSERLKSIREEVEKKSKRIDW